MDKQFEHMQKLAFGKKPINESTTKSAFKKQIKEMILAEMNVDISDDDKFYDFLTEEADEESEYDSMSDSELIELANDDGMEEMIVRDGEGGLANRQEIIDALKGPMSEAKKKKKDEAPEEMDAEIDAEVDTEIPMDAPEPSHTDVQKELTDALEAAKASGDEKLVRQIGNALTYFTRSQVAGEEGNMSGLNESFVKKMQRTAGIIK